MQQQVAAIMFSIGGRQGIIRGDEFLYMQMLKDPAFDPGSVIATYYQAPVEAKKPEDVVQVGNVSMSKVELDTLLANAVRWKKVRGVVQVVDDSGYRFHIDPCYLKANGDMMRGSVAEHFTKTVDAFKLF